MHQFQSFIHHGKIRRNPLAPSITVSNFFYNTLFLFSSFLAYLYIKTKVGTHSKRRVYIYQFYTAVAAALCPPPVSAIRKRSERDMAPETSRVPEGSRGPPRPRAAGGGGVGDGRR